MTSQPSMSGHKTVGVVGTGNMGSALVKGWLRSAEQAPGGPEVELIVWDKVEAAAQRLVVPGPISMADSLEDLVTKADVVLVVVKPKDSAEVLGAMASLVRDDQTVVSAMGGVAMSSIRSLLGPVPTLLRIMPNLGVELGVGALAVAWEPSAAPETVQEAVDILRLLGSVEAVPEDMLDAVTAVSGSGPAFLALAVEGLEDGAVASGLSRSAARRLVRHAALSTARSLPPYSDLPEQPGTDPGEVCIADKTTMEVLGQRGVRSAFRRAVEAALERSRGLRDANPPRSER